MGCRLALAVVLAVVAFASLATGALGEALVPLDGPFASAPIYATGPPGDGRLFIVERDGQIDVRDGATMTTFLTVPDVAVDGERGLLSMAFPPDYATSGLFYVFKVSSADNGQLQIIEYRVAAGDPDRAEPGSARVVLRQDHDHANNHNGGQLQFGPDGDLYATLGDGGDTPEKGQNTNSLLGKVLRIDPRAQSDGSAYGIPSTNPFAGNTRCGPSDGTQPCPEIFAYGLRNPFRASFDRLAGDFVVADVGENTWEEVSLGGLTDRATGENGLRGANLGWGECEGNFDAASVTDPCPPGVGQVPPFFSYPHEGNPARTGCAVIGGFVVRDPTLSTLNGRYLYGDLCRADLRTLDLGAGGPDPKPAGLVVLDHGSLLSFGEDARGCVYALADQRAYRVAASASDQFACPNPVTPAFPGIAGSPPARTAPPTLRVARAVGARRGAVRVAVTCDEACDLTARGTLSFSRAAAASSRLRTAHARADAGQRTTLTLRLSRAQRARARRAKRTIVHVTVTARDGAGNVATTRLRRAYSAA